jgi:hypothetical protein
MAVRPNFQKRHYAAIAKVIARAKARPWASVPEAIADIEQELCDLFQLDNPEFRPGYFFAACDPLAETRVVLHSDGAPALRAMKRSKMPNLGRPMGEPIGPKNNEPSARVFEGGDGAENI